MTRRHLAAAPIVEAWRRRARGTDLEDRSLSRATGPKQIPFGVRVPLI
jgi:hypothetical protein